MKQIHIRRFLSLLLAALTLWAAAVTAGSDSAAAALQQLRQGSRLPQQALRWELGDFFGLDSLSAVTVMTLAQSPLLLAGRSTVAALLSAGVTRDPPEPVAPESPDTPSPSADPSLTDGLTFADNGVPAQTTAPTSSKGYTVVNGVYLKNSSGTELDADALSDGSFAAQLTDDGPQVLIVHSHGSEAYTMPAGQEYTPTGSFRTDNDACNVVRVGDEIAAACRSVAFPSSTTAPFTTCRTTTTPTPTVWLPWRITWRNTPLWCSCWMSTGMPSPTPTATNISWSVPRSPTPPR